MRYIIRALLLAAVVTVSGPAGGALGQGGPIKIGLLAPLSGAFSPGKYSCFALASLIGDGSL